MALEPGTIDDSFLTVAEVATMLKLNQQTVRNWIDQGSLPALRVGRRVRIRRSDLEQVLAARYTGSANSAGSANSVSSATSADSATSAGSATSAPGAASPGDTTNPPGGVPASDASATPMADGAQVHARATPSADAFWSGETVGLAAEPPERRAEE